MKKSIVLMVCFLLVSQVVGQAASQVPQNSFWESYRPMNYEIGPEVFYHQYKEPGLMKDTGMMYGFYWSLAAREWLPSSTEDKKDSPQWMVATDGSFAYGKVNYDGQLQDGTPYTVNNISDFMVDVRLLTGPDFPKETRMDTIYTGIGFRYLVDDSSFDPAGYQRESKYLYVPVGFTTIGQVKEGWSLGGTAEFDIFVWGQQTSHLSDLGGPDIDNHQSKGYGLRGSVRLCKKGKNADFITEPFVRYWKIQTSEEEGGGVEPKNETVQYGVRFIWRF